MPQLDTSIYITQIFWLLTTFLSFWLIMDKFVVPKIAEKIEERKRRYNDYILKAEEINKKALLTLKNYEEKLAVAKKDAIKQINANEEELAEFVQKQQEAINLKLKQQVADNEEKLASEMKVALANVDEMAKNVAWKIVECMDLNFNKEDIENAKIKTGAK